MGRCFLERARRMMLRRRIASCSCLGGLAQDAVLTGLFGSVFHPESMTGDEPRTDLFIMAETALTLDRMEGPMFSATQARTSATLTLTMASWTSSAVRST